MNVLEPIGERIWIVEGTPVSFHGFPYPTRMVVVRLDSGALWVWSPVALDERVRTAIDQLGEPRFVVEPNKLHHLALTRWAAAWPSLRIYAPPGLAKKRKDLSFTGELGDDAPPEWLGQIDQVCVAGSFALTEVVFFHRASSTCIVGDLVQRFDEHTLGGFQRFLMKLDGLVGHDGSTPREWRLSFLRRARLRASLARAIAWSPRHLVIAHGACALDDGASVLRNSLRWALGAT